MKRELNLPCGPPAIVRTVLVCCVSAWFVGCSGDDPAGPGAPDPAGLLVLNSTGQTLAPFAIGAVLERAGSPIDLGPSFDGQSVAVSGGIAVSTVSSFGGSSIVVADLVSGDVSSAILPGPDAALSNPSAPSFDDAGIVWVGGRGSDAVYRLDPGRTVAERVATDVGTFVERVVPAGDLLYAIDSNLDDDGLTYRPLGPGRVVVLDRAGTTVDEIDLPEGVVNAFDAVVTGDYLIVLATGSFDAGFAPAADGHLAVVRLSDGSMREVLPLQANGIWLELGADGDVYVTTTLDFVSTEVLRYDPAAGAFVSGPGSGIEIVDAGGSPVTCWVATALADGRMVCATFAFAEAGRLVLAGPDGSFIAELPSGFGSTDLLVR